MVEYIERAALLNEFCRDNCERQYDGTCHNCRMTDTIADFPAAEVVEVIRCRECEHYHAGTGWCDQLSYFQTPNGEPCSPAESMEWKMFQENDFCSMGQRKIETVLPKSDAKDESLEGD